MTDHSMLPRALIAAAEKISGDLGPLTPVQMACERSRMFIHQWPTNQFWAALVRALLRRGYSPQRVNDFLQSPDNRILFPNIEAAIEEIAERYATIIQANEPKGAI